MFRSCFISYILVSVIARRQTKADKNDISHSYKLASHLQVLHYKTITVNRCWGQDC